MVERQRRRETLQNSFNRVSTIYDFENNARVRQTNLGKFTFFYDNISQSCVNEEITIGMIIPLFSLSCFLIWRLTFVNFQYCCFLSRIIVHLTYLLSVHFFLFSSLLFSLSFQISTLDRWTMLDQPYVLWQYFMLFVSVIPLSTTASFITML